MVLQYNGRVGDLRYGMRNLAKSPGFTLAVVALLAVGIGANTAFYSVLDALLLRPLPVAHPEQLVRMVQDEPRIGVTSMFVHEVYDELHRAKTLSAVLGEAEWPVAMDDPKPAEQVRVHLVTPGFFEVLGVPALIGRTFTADDERDEPGMPPAVLSYGFWQRRFASDPRAVGRTIGLRGRQFLIVGVMPRRFNGIYADNAPDLRIPLRAVRLLQFERVFGAGGVGLEIAARVKPGVALAQAQSECTAIWRAATEEGMQRTHQPADFIAATLARGIRLEPIAHGVSALRERFGFAARLIAASAGLLLLLMCANLAGLLLTRNAARREEMAIRLAVGATRTRLMRQLFAECALLALGGAVAGCMLALAFVPLLLRSLPPLRDRLTTPLALSLDVTPNWRVLLFAVGVTLATTLAFGLAPALSATRASLDSVLRGARSSRRGRHRDALVFVQVALCTLLLAGAGLLVRSFQRLRDMDPGFDAAHVVTFTAFPSLSGYTRAQCDQLRAALLARVKELPGVLSAATASRAVMRGSGVKMTVQPEGQPFRPSDALNTSENTVSTGYFATMGMRMVAGRDFEPSDLGAKPTRVIVNQTFAQQFFPDGSAVGRRLWNGLGTVWEIAGVVNDAKYRSLREPMTQIFYNLGSDDVFILCVRTRVAPASMVQPVRRELAALDPALPFTEIHTLSEEVDASAAGERLTAALASLFGLLAALLAALGIYGLLSYAVAQRRREIGIRMAVGANGSDIVTFIAVRAAIPVALGVAAGCAAAWRIGPMAQSLLYGVGPGDLVSFAMAAAFVVAISCVATAVPARRAARIQPASALRDTIA